MKMNLMKFQIISMVLIIASSSFFSAANGETILQKIQAKRAANPSTSQNLLKSKKDQLISQKMQTRKNPAETTSTTNSYSTQSTTGAVKNDATSAKSNFKTRLQGIQNSH